ncbi:glycosyltransferase [Marinobacter metalliresistant]|uniref:Glycosyltransferase n=1 Tax=Marinobacter metalliresistant TaxID=2961995 RepID=A0ABZ2W4Y9_9GAMM
MSILNQGYYNLEVVVVDDNQFDSTANLSEELCFDPRVRVVRNPGSHGPSQARNFGVQSAIGELITFLDDDDFYLPGRLSSIMSFYEQSGDRYSFISAGRFAEMDDFSEIQPIPGQRFGVISLENIKFGNSIDIGVLMKKEFFEQLGGFDEKLSSLEDWDLFIRALKVKDGYKIKRFDYAVSRTEGRDRVSEREAAGYFDIAEKYSKEFGYKWTFIPRSKGLNLAGQFSLAKAVFYSYRSSSLLPARIYLSSRFPRMIRITKELSARRQP